MAIVEMTRQNAAAVAALHRQSIRTGLAAWLGQRFCEQLYWGMARSPHSFVLVYEDQQHQAVGFICCATNTSRMYRSVVVRRFVPLMLTILGKVLTHPSVLKSMWKALRRPKTFHGEGFAQWNLPETELVSIGVAPTFQGKHLGTGLVEAAMERLRRLGHQQVRVWTSEDNLQATAFYQKRGFRLLGMRKYHTGGIRLFVKDLNQPAAPTEGGASPA
jgi:ribosomal protein S18 acetylase RimI-like enzyme